MLLKLAPSKELPKTVRHMKFKVSGGAIQCLWSSCFNFLHCHTF